MTVNGRLDGRVTATDVDGDPLAYSVGSLPAHGTAVIDAATGACEYTPFGGYSGSDSFSFQVTDGNEVDSVTIAVQVS